MNIRQNEVPQTRNPDRLSGALCCGTLGANRADRPDR